MSTPRIAVVGSFMQALCWQAPRLPELGESMAAAGFWSAPAGKGLAVAVGCHRLGAHVDLLLAIGDDGAGEALLACLHQEGLHARHVQRHVGPSGHGAGWVTADGQNAILAFAGANALLDAAQVARAGQELAQANVVYAQLETPVTAAREAFARARLARKAGTGQGLTVLNPSPWQALDAELLALTDVLVVNDTEARQLLSHGLPMAMHGTEASTWAHAVAAWWPTTWPGDERRWLIITRGARGSLAFSPTGECLVTPAPAVQASDSIGAGDAFAAGLCTALGEGRTMADALRRANACGAFAVSRRGILEGLPRAAELARMPA